MKLGLRDPAPGAVKLRLASYLNWRQLPPAPTEFGHPQLVKEWQVLGNNDYGDCAFAGAAHQIMLWCAEGQRPVRFSDNTVLANYSAVTGFNRADPETDQGTTIADLARYWRRTGLVDDFGVRHRIVAYLDLNPGDLRELWAASYLFQSVGLGFDLPQSAIEQTRARQIWDHVPGSLSVGGHYVPNMGRFGGLGYGVSWGQPQPFTAKFFTHHNNQGIVALSEEMMVRGKSIDGFDDKLLRDDLKQFAKA